VASAATDKRSPAEALLAQHIAAYQLPPPVLQHQPHPSRKWRLDFAWPKEGVCVEVHGAVHRIRERHHADAERELWLVAAGWRVLRVTPAQVASGLAIDAIRWLLGACTAEDWYQAQQAHGLHLGPSKRRKS
jgi:very-short-patch-repair endonuclease